MLFVIPTYAAAVLVCSDLFGWVFYVRQIKIASQFVSDTVQHSGPSALHISH